MSGWIAVDFDATLSHYDTWRGPYHTGEPIPAMVERVKRWLAEGREVRVFTARMSFPDWEINERVIKAWCLEHIGQELQVTCVKDGGMDELWDDRAVAVEPNTGRQLSPSRRGLDD